MEARYSRNVPAISEAECALLRTKRICVVGCGGLGGNLIELMTRVGVGAIRAVDGDVFEPSNLNRQLLSEMDRLGTGKAEAAADRIRRINPDIEAEAVHAFLTEENARELIRDCDAVLDALDNIDARRILAKACSECGIPLVYGAIRGWVAQAAISMPSDGLMDILYPDSTRLTDKSVLAFTPALCAAMQTSLCVRLLLGRPVDTGTVYYADLLNTEFEILPMV